MVCMISMGYSWVFQGDLIGFKWLISAVVSAAMTAVHDNCSQHTLQTCTMTRRPRLTFHAPVTVIILCRP